MTCPLSPALLARIQRFFPEDSDAAGWEAERPLVPTVPLSTLFPTWPVVPIPWCDMEELIHRGFLHSPRKDVPWTTFFSPSQPS